MPPMQQQGLNTEQPFCQGLNRRAENVERTIGAVTYDEKKVEKKCGYHGDERTIFVA